MLRNLKKTPALFNTPVYSAPIGEIVTSTPAGAQKNRIADKERRSLFPLLPPVRFVEVVLDEKRTARNPKTELKPNRWLEYNDYPNYDKQNSIFCLETPSNH